MMCNYILSHCHISKNMIKIKKFLPPNNATSNAIQMKQACAKSALYFVLLPLPPFKSNIALHYTLPLLPHPSKSNSAIL